jgi:hypothetical protein
MSMFQSHTAANPITHFCCLFYLTTPFHLCVMFVTNDVLNLFTWIKKSKHCLNKGDHLFSLNYFLCVTFKATNVRQ